MPSRERPSLSHQPVLLSETLSILRPKDLTLFVDCTVGEGGHLEAVLNAMGPSGTAAGLDRDSEIIEAAKIRLESFGSRARLFTGSYMEIGEVLGMMGKETADGLLFDLGLSSYPLEEPRGVAFSSVSPLDMRFDRNEDVPTAADVVNSASQTQLEDILRSLGEEKRARRIARAICKAREEGRIETTGQLSVLIEKAVGRSGRIHPATRTFQALRIHVNSEMEHLRETMAMVPRYLSPGGRAAVISYHSIEDRIVKQAMKSWEAEGTCTVLTKKPIVAGKEEVAANPRSRSAKLRASERR